MGDDDPAAGNLGPEAMRERIEAMREASGTGDAPALKHLLARLCQLVCAPELVADDDDSRAVKLIDEAIDAALALEGYDDLLEVRDALRHLKTHLVRVQKKQRGLATAADSCVQAVLEVDRRVAELKRVEDARDAAEEKQYASGIRTADAAAQSDRIARKVAALLPSSAEVTAKEELQGFLQKKLRAKFPSATVSVYGSSASGLCLAGADLDLAVRLDGPRSEALSEGGSDDNDADSDEGTTSDEDEAQSSEDRAALPSEQAEEMKHSLERQREEMMIRDIAAVLRPHVTEVLEITAARVPILTLKQGNQECDIAVDHELPQRNTLLLRTYQQIDPRARELMLVVKIWAKQAGVADSANGSLSSYAWALLSIFFLQQVEPPVLPVLQHEALIGAKWKKAAVQGCCTSFCEDAVEAAASLSEHNTSNVAELLHQFFHFYGWKFQFAQQVVSPRKGNALMRTGLQSKHDWRLCIEDPFERLRDLGSTVTATVGQRTTTRALRHAAAAMQAHSSTELPDCWISESAAPTIACSNCCQTGHHRRECPTEQWSCELLCFSCGDAGHTASQCPVEAKNQQQQKSCAGGGSPSGMRKLNGMRPFPLSFDPAEEHAPAVIPSVFNGAEEYFEVMQTNICAEVSATVRFSTPDEITAEVVGHGMLRFPPSKDSEHSWWKHLMRTPTGDCYIIREEEAEYAVEQGGRPSPRIVEIKEMPFVPVGELMVFRSYGYLGDMIAAYLSVNTMRKWHKTGRVVPLLTAALSGGNTKAYGIYAENDGVVRGNREQQAVLTGLSTNMPVIQGPPGTGKTRLISQTLKAKIQPGTSALVTSVSNQAIDNLSEVLEKTRPDLRFVTLGKPKRFLELGALALFKNSLEVQTMRSLLHSWCGNTHGLTPLSDQDLLDMIQSPTIEPPRRNKQRPWKLLAQCVAGFQSHLDEWMQRTAGTLLTFPSRYQRDTVNLRRAQLRLQFAKLVTSKTSPASILSHDIVGLVATTLGPIKVTRAKLALWKHVRQSHVERVCVEVHTALDAPFQEQLNWLLRRHTSKVINQASVFVCTVGSIERAAKDNIRVRNIRTAIVDEASLLPEYAVPRLLTLELDNLILVGDHKQLQPFTHDRGAKVCGSLMQRCADTSGCQMLTEQYRMAPEICSVVSHVFYGGKLRTNQQVAVDRRKAQLCKPVQVYDCSTGVEAKLAGSSSFYNIEEVLEIEGWYTAQREGHGMDYGAKDSATWKAMRNRSILIITFYSAQVCLIYSQHIAAFSVAFQRT